MRWTGSRLQLMSFGWQALIQRTPTEASCLDLKRPIERREDERREVNGEIYDMCKRSNLK